MPSSYTRNLLSGVYDLLHGLINDPDNKINKLNAIKSVALAKLQYKAWEDSYKLEAHDRPQFAYSNLLDEDKKLDAKVQWYITLLDSWFTVEGIKAR